MSESMETVRCVASYLWQLPQNLVGLVAAHFAKSVTTHRVRGCVVLISPRFRGGIALGRYVILRRDDAVTIRHELGHCRQSRYLGPLYLPVVGLPSLLHAAVHGSWCHDATYYHFWTERWADSLGGVKR